MPIVYGEPSLKYFETDYNYVAAMPGESKEGYPITIRTNVAELEKIPVRVVIAAKMGGSTTCTVEALDKNNNVITSMSLDSGSNTLLAYRGVEIKFSQLPVKVRVANDSSSATGVTAAITAYPFSWNIGYYFIFRKLYSRHLTLTLSNGGTRWRDIGGKIAIGPPHVKSGSGWGSVYIDVDRTIPGALYTYGGAYTTGIAQQPGSYYLDIYKIYVVWV